MRDHKKLTCQARKGVVQKWPLPVTGGEGMMIR